MKLITTREEKPPQDSVTSSTHLDTQCEEEDLETYSSEHSEELQGEPIGDDGHILIALFDGEDLEPLSGEDCSDQPKNCGTAFQELTELQEYKQNHLAECFHCCPICSREFFQAANLHVHKFFHSRDGTQKCPECHKGFIYTADVWRHLCNMHWMEHSKMVVEMVP
ncbi:hypothetical protein EI555_008417 [Monodon monoceros]|uniref:C2H2-type domain-containing protein n=1 Tax=Monodon monoceros TaxID=40151 RepID=A0A4U1FHW4_MONMO|nr:hypothetical protein EI555_008417 [Monodon monoceros]